MTYRKKEPRSGEAVMQSLDLVRGSCGNLEPSHFTVASRIQQHKDHKLVMK